MPTFTRISTEQAYQLMQGDVSIVDVRDPQSFRSGHITDALLLDNNTVQSFIENTPKTTPVIVYCYHGNSSQQAGQFLAEQGFESVYSMDGGFEAWKVSYPQSSN